MLGCHAWHANALLRGVRTPTDEQGRSDTNGGAGTRAQDVERTGFALLRIRRSTGSLLVHATALQRPRLRRAAQGSPSKIHPI
jgi:hypothetical protein